MDLNGQEKDFLEHYRKAKPETQFFVDCLLGLHGEEVKEAALNHAKENNMIEE